MLLKMRSSSLSPPNDVRSGAGGAAPGAAVLMARDTLGWGVWAGGAGLRRRVVWRRVVRHAAGGVHTCHASAAMIRRCGVAGAPQRMRRCPAQAANGVVMRE